MVPSYVTIFALSDYINSLFLFDQLPITFGHCMFRHQYKNSVDALFMDDDSSYTKEARSKYASA